MGRCQKKKTDLVWNKNSEIWIFVFGKEIVECDRWAMVVGTRLLHSYVRIYKDNYIHLSTMVVA